MCKNGGVGINLFFLPCTVQVLHGVDIIIIIIIIIIIKIDAKYSIYVNNNL